MITVVERSGVSRALLHKPSAVWKVPQVPRLVHGAALRLGEFRLAKYHDVASRPARYATVAEPPAGLSSEAQALIQDLVQSRPGRSQYLQDGGPESDQYVGMGAVDTASPHQELDLPRPFIRALKAVQQRDTRRLLTHLKEIVRLPEHELTEAVRILPRTTFTEFLRSLDPHSVRRDIDPTDGTHLSFGMLNVLNMSAVVDEYGVRKVYTRLLRRMLILDEAMRRTGRGLSMEEYIYLMRCAGAASDIDCVKQLWRRMEQLGLRGSRHSEVYSEFISARFLVDPLYTGYDKLRRAVLPRNLHRSRLNLHGTSVRKLDGLRYRLRSTKSSYGTNMNVPYAEDMMRRLRKRGPVRRLFTHLKEKGAEDLTEQQLCNLIVAFGRSGSLRAIASDILEPHFGIKLMQKASQDVPTWRLTYRITRGEPRVVPGPRVMRAIVEAYCSNSEFDTALNILFFIRDRHGVPISGSLFLEILEWTYVMSSKSVKTMWKMARMDWKIPSSSSVEELWLSMTSDPHNVQPDFDHYNILIRSLIGANNVGRVFPYMREAVALYHEQCRVFEDSVFEYTQTLRDGVVSSESYLELSRARFTRSKMWFDVNTWCRAWLTKVNDDRPQTVPDFVAEFREFLGHELHYKTASGYVQLTDPTRDSFFRVSRAKTYLDVPRWDPITKTGRDRFLRVRHRGTLVLSPHSLGDRVSAKLDPFKLLSGSWDMFRTADLEKEYRRKRNKSVEEPVKTQQHHKSQQDDLKQFNDFTRKRGDLLIRQEKEKHGKIGQCLEQRSSGEEQPLIQFYKTQGKNLISYHSSSSRIPSYQYKGKGKGRKFDASNFGPSPLEPHT